MFDATGHKANSGGRHAGEDRVRRARNSAPAPATRRGEAAARKAPIRPASPSDHASGTASVIGPFSPPSSPLLATRRLRMEGGRPAPALFSGRSPQRVAVPSRSKPQDEGPKRSAGHRSLTRSAGPVRARGRGPVQEVDADSSSQTSSAATSTSSSSGRASSSSSSETAGTGSASDEGRQVALASGPDQFAKPASAPVRMRRHARRQALGGMKDVFASHAAAPGPPALLTDVPLHGHGENKMVRLRRSSTPPKLKPRFSHAAATMPPAFNTGGNSNSSTTNSNTSTSTGSSSGSSSTTNSITGVSGRRRRSGEPARVHANADTPVSSGPAGLVTAGRARHIPDRSMLVSQAPAMAVAEIVLPVLGADQPQWPARNRRIAKYLCSLVNETGGPIRISVRFNMYVDYVWRQHRKQARVRERGRGASVRSATAGAFNGLSGIVAKLSSASLKADGETCSRSREQGRAPPSVAAPGYEARQAASVSHTGARTDGDSHSRDSDDGGASSSHGEIGPQPGEPRLSLGEFLSQPEGLGTPPRQRKSAAADLALPGQFLSASHRPRTVDEKHRHVDDTGRKIVSLGRTLLALYRIDSGGAEDGGVRLSGRMENRFHCPRGMTPVQKLDFRLAVKGLEKEFLRLAGETVHGKMQFCMSMLFSRQFGIAVGGQQPPFMVASPFTITDSLQYRHDSMLLLNCVYGDGNMNAAVFPRREGSVILAPAVVRALVKIDKGYVKLALEDPALTAPELNRWRENLLRFILFDCGLRKVLQQCPNPFPQGTEDFDLYASLQTHYIDRICLDWELTGHAFRKSIMDETDRQMMAGPFAADLRSRRTPEQRLEHAMEMTKTMRSAGAGTPARTNFLSAGGRAGVALSPKRQLRLWKQAFRRWTGFEHLPPSLRDAMQKVLHDHGATGNAATLRLACLGPVLAYLDRAGPEVGGGTLLMLRQLSSRLRDEHFPDAAQYPPAQ